MIFREYITIISTVTIATLVLSFLSFYNYYPLILGDSIGYINRAFSGEVNHHWALFYSLFIRLTSFGYSLFFVVFAQNLLVVVTIFLIVRNLFLYKRYCLFFLTIFSILTVFSSLAHISNLLMSDIFTPIGLLSIISLIYFKRSVLEKFYFSILLVITYLAHNSHPPIFISFSAVTLLIYYLLRRTNQYSHEAPNHKITIYLVILFMLCSVVFRPFVNSFFKKGENISGNTNVERVSDSKFHFVWKKLRESGRYANFLEKYCPQKKYYYLCNPERMEELERDGIMNDMHGQNLSFLAEVEDAGKIVMSDPYYFWHSYKAKLGNIVAILTNHKIRNPFQNQSIEPILIEYLPEDRKYLVQSRSYGHRLFSLDQLSQLRNMNEIVILLSFFIVVFGFIILVRIRGNVKMLGVIAGLLIGHLVNSSFMGFFANPNARYCSRTSWMIIFAALLVVAHLFINRYKIKSYILSR